MKVWFEIESAHENNNNKNNNNSEKHLNHTLPDFLPLRCAVGDVEHLIVGN